MKIYQAVREARKKVSPLFNYGGGYGFNLKTDIGETLIGRGTYSDAVIRRADALIEIASNLLGTEPTPYEGGDWVGYLRNASEPFIPPFSGNAYRVIDGILESAPALPFGGIEYREWVEVEEIDHVSWRVVNEYFTNITSTPEVVEI